MSQLINRFSSSCLKTSKEAALQCFSEVNEVHSDCEIEKKVSDNTFCRIIGMAGCKQFAAAGMDSQKSMLCKGLQEEFGKPSLMLNDGRHITEASINEKKNDRFYQNRLVSPAQVKVENNGVEIIKVQQPLKEDKVIEIRTPVHKKSRHNMLTGVRKKNIDHF